MCSVKKFSCSCFFFFYCLCSDLSWIHNSEYHSSVQVTAKKTRYSRTCLALMGIGSRWKASSRIVREGWIIR